jgi:hypothetical protein
MRIHGIWAAAAAVALIGLWAVSRFEPPRSAAQPTGGAPPSEQRLRPLAGVLRGTASCAGRSCHGSIEPLSRTNCNQNEYTLWLTQDKHQQAYQALQSPAAEAMARHLGLKEKAHEAPLCLSCHTNPAATLVPAAPALVERVYQERLYGVGCEACHGAASGWLNRHIAADWRKKEPSEKRAVYGMTPVADVQELARVCAGCHVGAPPDKNRPLARDVNHDLIAAGHPRLAFEFSAFFANLPPHWRKKESKDDEARRWAAGQAASAEAALELLRHRAATTEAPWPEFAEYDCYACHHALSEPSWRQRPGGRGAIPWGSWYFALPRALADKKLPALEQLKDLMEKRLPVRAKVVEQIDQTLTEIRALGGWHDTAGAMLDSLLASKRLEQEPSWDACEQLFLALEALNGLAAHPVNREKLLQMRAFPRDQNGPRRDFDPREFFKILREGK